MLFYKKEYDDRLAKNIHCIKCRSKRLQINEEVTADNIYVTDEKGDLVDIDVLNTSTINPTYKIRIICLTCGYSFKKKGKFTISDILVEKE